MTSMLRFTLDKKYWNIRSFDEAVHANTRRMACRCDSASFLLPWHDVLVQLNNSEDAAVMKQCVPLPRVGSELAIAASI